MGQRPEVISQEHKHHQLFDSYYQQQNIVTAIEGWLGQRPCKSGKTSSRQHANHWLQVVPQDCYNDNKARGTPPTVEQHNNNTRKTRIEAL